MDAGQTSYSGCLSGWKSADKANYLPDFIRALEDEEVRVQYTALQALGEVTDPGLMEIYEQLLRQHKTNKDYILSRCGWRNSPLPH